MEQPEKGPKLDLKPQTLTQHQLARAPSLGRVTQSNH